MGSAIGDYIHYRANNYLHYGINRIPEGPSGGAGDALKVQRTMLEQALNQSRNKGINKNNSLELTRRLRWLMEPTMDAVTSKVPAEDYNLLWNLLIPFFQQEFGEAAEQIQRSTANISAGPSVDNFKKIKQKANQDFMYASTIRDRLRSIREAIRVGQYTITDVDGNSRKIKYTQKELDLLINLKKSIEKDISDLEATVRSKFASAQIGENGQWAKRGQQLDIDSMKGIVDKVNLLSTLGRGTVNLYKGTLFEYMIAVAPLIGQKLTLTAVKNAIDSCVKGGEKTSVTYDPAMFSDKINLANVLSSNYKINDGLWEANKSSQDKVDVTITLGEGDQAQTLNISAKNKNIRGEHAQPIKLTESSPMLALLASLGNNAFVNHYLNQAVDHPYAGVSTFMGNLTGDVYNDMKKIMALSLAEKALRGYKTGANQADVFVLNDNATGMITVKNIADILEDFIGRDYSSLIVEDQNGNTLSQLCIPMSWSEAGAYDRITKVLAAVHNIKLTISITPSYFY